MLIREARYAGDSDCRNAELLRSYRLKFSFGEDNPLLCQVAQLVYLDREAAEAQLVRTKVIAFILFVQIGDYDALLSKDIIKAQGLAVINAHPAFHKRLFGKGFDNIAF